MNAAIRAVTRSAIYNGMRVKGIYRGYKGLILDEIEEFKTQNVSNIIQRGGTILKTARCVEFKTPEGRKQAYDKLQEHGIDALIAIGGDGTLTGARIFAQEFNFPIVGLPGTIDNDLYGTDTTIGYDTALNTIMECVDKIRDTATSHDRLFYVGILFTMAANEFATWQQSVLANAGLPEAVFTVPITISSVLLWVAAILTVISGIQYVYNGRRFFKNS